VAGSPAEAAGCTAPPSEGARIPALGADTSAAWPRDEQVGTDTPAAGTGTLARPLSDTYKGPAEEEGRRDSLRPSRIALRWGRIVQCRVDATLHHHYQLRHVHASASSCDGGAAASLYCGASPSCDGGAASLYCGASLSCGASHGWAPCGAFLSSYVWAKTEVICRERKRETEQEQTEKEQGRC